jgi:hypothetical protein
MKEIVGTIQRDKNFEYVIDKNGNIIKRKYSLLRDPYTLVTIALLILGGAYYMQMKDSITNADNFDKYCMMYLGMRNEYIMDHPFEEITFKKVTEWYNSKDKNAYPNFSGGGNG